MLCSENSYLKTWANLQTDHAFDWSQISGGVFTVIVITSLELGS